MMELDRGLLESDGLLTAARHVRMSPQKMRLVIDKVRGGGIEEALAGLRFMPQRAARSVAKLIRSAAASAEDRCGVGAGELHIAQICADDGPRLRRYRFGARLRIKPRIRQTSHITVVLGCR
jgi:large subunit ribosomal protein L22